MMPDMAMEFAGKKRMAETILRLTSPEDVPAIKALYPMAFPDEDLLPVVTQLLQLAPAVLSLAAFVGTDLVGHVIFTPCSVADSQAPVALLAPLAVAPARQRQGIGSGLVQDGLHRLEGDGFVGVCVLGDPAYYGRLGFRPEYEVGPPYPLPEAWREAWQSVQFGSADAIGTGTLDVPLPWRRPALWAP